MTIHRPEPLGKVRTKIVATVGPVSRDPSVLRNFVEAGVDVFRLNFSHGTHQEHTETLRAIREIGKEFGRAIAVLQDLGGPKLRLGPIPEDRVDCRTGDEFVLATERTSENPRVLTCTYRELPRDLKPDDVVLFADGAVAMVVTRADGDEARLTVTLGGSLRSRQGLNLPGAALGVKALTDKDLLDLDWSAKEGVDYVGLSFVRKSEDIRELRRQLDARGSRARIVAKIEKPQALDDLKGILAETDVVMVARGDLGVEMDVERVPAIQKRVIAACRRARVPVITATQMLNSMESSSRPTRAEATDVFNAVLDGTDAVMLSGETAVGSYPVEAIGTMSRIVSEAEAFLGSGAFFSLTASESEAAPDSGRAWVLPITEAVVDAAGQLGRALNAAILVVATRSGRTALALSKSRELVPTIAVTDDETVYRASALYWGVTPILVPRIDQADQTLAIAVDWASARGLVKPGDRVVLLQGALPDNPAHNAISVFETS